MNDFNFNLNLQVTYNNTSPILAYLSSKKRLIQAYGWSKTGQNVPDLVTDTEKEVMRMMFLEAAKGFQLQCGSEYGFGNSELPTRNATKLPIENVSTCETLLSTFSRRAVVSKCRNKQFSAKGIHDDIVLFQSKQSSTSSKKDSCYFECERKVMDRSAKTKAKRENSEEIDATRIHDEYVKKLLKLCKSWGGPCTNPTEIQVCLQNKSDIEQKLVKTELSYYIHTHQFQRYAVPELFKINIPHEERLEYLLLLVRTTR